jgi:hypothetical protein
VAVSPWILISERATRRRWRSSTEGAVWASIFMMAWSLPQPVSAQRADLLEIRNAVFVNSEVESYLRLLQTTGKVAAYPWSIRSFSPYEVDRLSPSDSLHPWAQRYDWAPRKHRGLRFQPVAPHAELRYNSAFPYGPNLGPVWAGRGATGALLAGASARLGPASVVAAPVFFHARNRAFELASTGHGGALRYSDPRRPLQIDLPQRFGDGGYTRIDPGQSTLRLDLRAVTFGVSTANQHWGPAAEYPILLGSNAGGFLHGFLGTAAPLDLWLASFHGRFVWGRLDQSEFTDIVGRERRRFMSGLVVSLAPRGLDGLELGFGRFYHIPWPKGGPGSDHFFRPLEEILKQRRGPIEGDDADGFSTPENQLASVFARWVHPASGFELYGEYGREDHNWDVRDFLLQPDHDSAYMLGFRKAWPRSDTRILVLRGEVLNARITHLEQVRPQERFYVHSRTRQGHTHRGQILGAPAGYGGAGSELGLDLYHEGGRWSVGWRRDVRGDRVVAGPDGRDPTRDVDVVHALESEGLFFIDRFDLFVGVRAVQNFNRNFDGDVFNLGASLGVRAGF